MKNVRLAKILGIFLVGFLLTSVNATTIDDYYNQINDIKAKQKAAADKLTGVEKEIQENLYDIIDLDEKVTKYT